MRTAVITLEDRRPTAGPRRPGVVVPVRVDPTGRAGPTPGAVRGSGWRRSSRGWWVPAGVEVVQPAQRIVEAAVVLPAFGAVTAWSGLHVQGATWCDGRRADGSERAVVLAVGSGKIRPQPGFRTSAERLAPDDIEWFDGVPVTSAVRSVAFEMRYAASLRAAVEVCSMACYDDLVSLDEVRAYLDTLNGWTGVPRAREALPWCREDAWSPREVFTELVWRWEGGLPPVMANRPVFDLRGRHVATPDLLEPVAGLAIDYHGAVHLDATGRARDRDRELALRAVGLECLSVFNTDLRDTARLASRMRQAYADRLAAPAAPRAWTLVQPAWWTDTSTVARRRALTPEQRTRVLRYRRTPAARA